MGQEEAFQVNSDRIFNNTKSIKNNNYINNPQTKANFHPLKSLFEFLYVVGRGGFGKVWMVKYKKTHQKFALKEMSKVKIIDRKSEKSIKNEREFLSQIHHPFIVNMICSFQDYENLYLVMDLLTGGDLRYHICHKKQFNEDQSRFFSSCILLGLEYIHNNNIIHRDIKPENLVLDEKGYVRITDFGVAKKNLRDNSSETSGTPGYMAPEVLCALNHSFPVDFFALGVIIFEFMNGFRPYLGRNRKEIKEEVLSRQVHIHRKDLLENGWSLESGDLINKLLYRKPHKRLGSNGIKEIKEHNWFKSINWDELLNKKMKSPFIPKDGDNFDKRYCEGIEQIDTQTKERYQYYKSKSKFKTLFINYTFVREEDKQDYINSYKENININILNQKNKGTTSSNFISTNSTKAEIGNNNSSKYNNIFAEKNYKKNIEDPLTKHKNSNSMTNIHSFSILNDAKQNKNNNRNNKYFKEFDKENNNELNEEEDTQDKKLFYSTFKISNKMNNNNLFSDNINEFINEGDNTINVNFGNKIDELKVYINKKEGQTIKNNDFINNNTYLIKDKTFRSSSSLSKRQNDYHSLNNKKIDNQIKDSKKYYDVSNENNNSKNYTSIKININSPININKYKYNRSSSQTNSIYDKKGIKNNSGKTIKYINIDEEMDKTKNKLIQEQKNKTRNNKNKYKNSNNSNNNDIYINPSQFIYYPSHKNNNLGNNLSNTLKRSNKYKGSINVVNTNKAKNEYLIYKTSRYFNEKNKKESNENYIYFDNDNTPKIKNINNINSNNININFNISNINNNINHISRDNFNKTNIINNQRKSTSRVKGANSVTSYHNNNQKKYIFSNNISNSNIFKVNNLLYDDSPNKININQFNRYSKNNMIIECNDYDVSQFSKKNRESNINNNKNKILSKASSMKSFNYNNSNYIEKYLEQREKNNKNYGKQKKPSNNNFYYNFEILSPSGMNNGNIMNNNLLVEDNYCKNSYKNNIFFRKQKTRQVLSNKQPNIINNNISQNPNKYLINRNNI